MNTVSSMSARSLSFRVDLAAETLAGEWVETPQLGAGDVSVGVHFYRRHVTAAAGRVPVLFFFNGGPGASSTPLHFSGFGPYLVEEDADGAVSLLANPCSLLDVADLVFIDPVGTGFNRIPAEEEAGRPAERLLSVDGDAELSALVVREWLAAFGDKSGPVHLCGQSYGGFRVASVAPLLKDVDLRGLILISPALSMSARYQTLSNDLAYVLTMPTMAVAARHHGLTQGGEGVLELYHAAARFALDEYGPALAWGSALPAARRDALAQTLSQWIGLPLPRVLEQHLRIDAEAFMRELLAPQPLRIGSLDVRGTGSQAPLAGRPTNDPSLSLKKGSGRNEQYFREVFGLVMERPYVGLSFEVNGRWAWERPGFARKLEVAVVGDLLEAMADHAGLQVLAVGGVYDMSTPLLGTCHALTRPELPGERIRILETEGGHTPYESMENRACIGEAIRDLLAEEPGSGIAA